MSLIVIIFGKCGLKSIRFQKSNLMKCLLCKSKIAFGVLVVLTIATGFQFNEIHNVMEKVRSNGMMRKNIWRLHKNLKNES
jgi:ABC-type taurine transport system ATPase subunit